MCDGTIEVDQIIVEFHFGMHQGLDSKEKIQDANEVIVCMEENGWAMTYRRRAGTSRKDWIFHDDVIRAMPQGMSALYATFWKPINLLSSLIGERMRFMHDICIRGYNGDKDALEYLKAQRMTGHDC